MFFKLNRSSVALVMACVFVVSCGPQKRVKKVVPEMDGQTAEDSDQSGGAGEDSLTPAGRRLLNEIKAVSAKGKVSRSEAGDRMINDVKVELYGNQGPEVTGEPLSKPRVIQAAMILQGVGRVKVVAVVATQGETPMVPDTFECEDLIRDYTFKAKCQDAECDRIKLSMSRIDSETNNRVTISTTFAKSATNDEDQDVRAISYRNTNRRVSADLDKAESEITVPERCSAGSDSGNGGDNPPPPPPAPEEPQGQSGTGSQQQAPPPPPMAPPEQPEQPAQGEAPPPPPMSPPEESPAPPAPEPAPAEQPDCTQNPSSELCR